MKLRNRLQDNLWMKMIMFFSDFWTYVAIPPRPLVYVNFFKPFLFLAGDQLVVPIGVSQIPS